MYSWGYPSCGSGGSSGGISWGWAILIIIFILLFFCSPNFYSQNSRL